MLLEEWYYAHERRMSRRTRLTVHAPHLLAFNTIPGSGLSALVQLEKNGHDINIAEVIKGKMDYAQMMRLS